MARSYKTHENETKFRQIKWYMNHHKIPHTSDLMGQLEQFSGSCHQEQDQRRDTPTSQS